MVRDLGDVNILSSQLIEIKNPAHPTCPACLVESCGYSSGVAHLMVLG